MNESNNKCFATLKNGEPCRYNGRPEYKGYCGIHKAIRPSKSVTSGKGRDERLVLLLTAGVALVDITSKAIEYLPPMIEVLVKASNVAFCFVDERKTMFDGEMQFDGNKESRVPFLYTPRTLSENIAQALEAKDWQNLANMLAYEFDVQINSGNIPRPLSSAIYSKKKELMASLKKFGYEAGLHTADRPVYSRTLDE